MKHYHYVIVHVKNEQRFVTECNNGTKFAYWEEDKKPLQFSKKRAEDLVYCLNLNYYSAFIITSLFEIEKQIFIKEE